jgi:cell division septation protein DedD
LVSQLERGKYYVQLGAFSRAETLERELRKLGKSWPLAVQNAGTADRPVYRLLVGPVNHGESGALLQRFKGGGYKDAFVRQGG